MDLFEPGSGSQVHDYNGGIQPSGLFWIVELPDSAFRVSRDGKSETFLSGLMNPTGIAFSPDGTLFVLEAGRSRVLRVAALEKGDRTASATALN